MAAPDPAQNRKIILGLASYPDTIPRTLAFYIVYFEPGVEDRDQEKIYSKRVRAGKRTYFFDVRATRGQDYYLILTESRRHPQGDGFSYDKQKMFLYKEDFAKFVEALQETIDYVKNELMPGVDFTQFDRRDEVSSDVNGALKWE